MSEDQAPAAGDLVWVDFSPTAGTEQSGRRPALVISDQGINEILGRALMMPVTSKVRDWPLMIPLPESSPVRGAVIVDQVRAIDFRARYAKSIGPAPDGVLQDARERLAVLAGI